MIDSFPAERQKPGREAAQAEGGADGVGRRGRKHGSGRFAATMNRLMPPARLASFIVFFITVAVLQLAFLLRGIPYNGKTLLIVDLFHQYAPFLAEFRERLLSGSSLFFSWSGGLGVSFYATLSYYMASPLNLLLVAFPADRLTEVILILVLVKVGLSSSFFLQWIRGVFGRDGYGAMAISLMYALSGFTLAYFWNVMWMDCIFLLPLVLLGVQRLVEKGTGILYVVAMGLTLFVNFYIAFFAALFSGLWFLVCLFMNAGKLGRKTSLIRTGRFALLSAFSVGLSAVMIIPTMAAMRHTSATGDAFPKDASAYFDLFDYFARHLLDTVPTIRSGLPNMYCGIAVVLLVPVFFLSRRISRTEKILKLLLLVFLIFSFDLNVLNFIWHGFHYPNQLPFRNSFVWIFLLASMAYPAYESIGDFTGRQWAGILGSGVALTLLSQKIVAENKPSFPGLYLDILFLIAYAVIFSSKGLEGRRVMNREFVFFLVVVVELGLNACMMEARLDKNEYFSSRNQYAAGNEVMDLKKAIDRLDEIDDSPFYRMSVRPAKTPNDPYLYGFNGLSIFSSMSREITAREMSRYGFHSNDINSYKDEGSTPVWDAFFGIRYRVLRQAGEENYLRDNPGTLMFAEGTSLVYDLGDVLSLGFMAPSTMKDWSSVGQNPLQIQNALMQNLSGEADLFRNIGIAETTAGQSTLTSTQEYKYHVDYPDKKKQAIVKLTINDPGDGYLCLWYQCTTSHFGIGNVFVGERKMSFNSTRSTLLDIGRVPAGEKVVVELWPNSKETGSYDFTLIPAILDTTRLATAIDSIQAHQLEITDMRDNGLAGTVDAAADGMMLTTIPYDDGWKVEVDGVAVQTRAFDEGLLAFDVGAGRHQIRLRFVPPGFWLGLEISFFCLLFLIIGRWRKAAWLCGNPASDEEAVPEIEADAGADLPDGMATKEGRSAASGDDRVSVAVGEARENA